MNVYESSLNLTISNNDNSFFDIKGEFLLNVENKNQNNIFLLLNISNLANITINSIFTNNNNNNNNNTLHYKLELYSTFQQKSENNNNKRILKLNKKENTENDKNENFQLYYLEINLENENNNNNNIVLMMHYTLSYAVNTFFISFSNQSFFYLSNENFNFNNNYLFPFIHQKDTQKENFVALESIFVNSILFENNKNKNNYFIKCFHPFPMEINELCFLMSQNENNNNNNNTIWKEIIINNNENNNLFSFFSEVDSPLHTLNQFSLKVVHQNNNNSYFYYFFGCDYYFINEFHILVDSILGNNHNHNLKIIILNRKLINNNNNILDTLFNFQKNCIFIHENCLLLDYEIIKNIFSQNNNNKYLKFKSTLLLHQFLLFVHLLKLFPNNNNNNNLEMKIIANCIIMCQFFKNNNNNLYHFIKYSKECFFTSQKIKNNNHHLINFYQMENFYQLKCFILVQQNKTDFLPFCNEFYHLIVNPKNEIPFAKIEKYYQNIIHFLFYNHNNDNNRNLFFSPSFLNRIKVNFNIHFSFSENNNNNNNIHSELIHIHLSFIPQNNNSHYENYLLTKIKRIQIPFYLFNFIIKENKNNNNENENESFLNFQKNKNKNNYITSLCDAMPFSWDLIFEENNNNNNLKTRFFSFSVPNIFQLSQNQKNENNNNNFKPVLSDMNSQVEHIIHNHKNKNISEYLQNYCHQNNNENEKKKKVENNNNNNNNSGIILRGITNQSNNNNNNNKNIFLLPLIVFNTASQFPFLSFNQNNNNNENENNILDVFDVSINYDECLWDYIKNLTTEKENKKEKKKSKSHKNKNMNNNIIMEQNILISFFNCVLSFTVSHDCIKNFISTSFPSLVLFFENNNNNNSNSVLCHDNSIQSLSLFINQILISIFSQHKMEIIKSFMKSFELFNEHLKNGMYYFCKKMIQNFLNYVLETEMTFISKNEKNDSFFIEDEIKKMTETLFDKSNHHNRNKTKRQREKRLRMEKNYFSELSKKIKESEMYKNLEMFCAAVDENFINHNENNNLGEYIFMNDILYLETALQILKFNENENKKQNKNHRNILWNEVSLITSLQYYLENNNNNKNVLLDLWKEMKENNNNNFIPNENEITIFTEKEKNNNHNNEINDENNNINGSDEENNLFLFSETNNNESENTDEGENVEDIFI